MVNHRREKQKSDNFSDSEVSPMNVHINIQCSIDPTNPDSNGLKCKISRDPVPDEETKVLDIWGLSSEDEEDSEETVNEKDPEHDHDHQRKKVAVKKSKTLSRKAKDEEDQDDEDDSEDELDSDDESEDEGDDEEIIECVQKSTMKKR